MATSSRFSFNYGRADRDYVDTSRDLGSGSYGYVRSVRRRGDSSGTEYALKTVSNRNLAPLTNEIYIFCTFLHPNLMSTDRLYFTMEGDQMILGIIMRKGVSLSSYLRQPRPDGILRSLVDQLVDVLAWLQDNNIIYGDIKTSNIIIYERGSTPELRLSDFSLYYKWRCGDAPFSQTFPDLGGYAKKGHTTYESPEVLRPVVRPYDVIGNAMWALGITIVEILSGHIDYKPALGGIPISIYRITENPTIVLQREPINRRPWWHPTLMALLGPLETRPKFFKELLRADIRGGGDYTRSTVGKVYRTQRLPYYPFKEPVIDHMLAWLMSNNGYKGAVRSLAAEYLLRYTVRAHLGLNPWGNLDPDSLRRSLLSSLSRRTYSDSHGKFINSYQIFAVACLKMAENILDAEYIEQQISVTANLLVDNDYDQSRLVAGGIARNLFKLMQATSGSLLIRVPYFDDGFNVPDKDGILERTCTTVENYIQLVDDIESGRLVATPRGTLPVQSDEERAWEQMGYSTVHLTPESGGTGSQAGSEVPPAPEALPSMWPDLDSYLNVAPQPVVPQVVAEGEVVAGGGPDPTKVVQGGPLPPGVEVVQGGPTPRSTTSTLGLPGVVTGLTPQSSTTPPSSRAPRITTTLPAPSVAPTRIPLGTSPSGAPGPTSYSRAGGQMIPMLVSPRPPERVNRNPLGEMPLEALYSPMETDTTTTPGNLPPTRRGSVPVNRSSPWSSMFDS